jgi:hypothetical protein
VVTHAVDERALEIEEECGFEALHRAFFSPSDFKLHPGVCFVQ